MFIHLGQDTVVNDKEIVGIFDIENTTISSKNYCVLFCEPNGSNLKYVRILCTDIP